MKTKTALQRYQIQDRVGRPTHTRAHLSDAAIALFWRHLLQYARVPHTSLHSTHGQSATNAECDLECNPYAQKKWFLVNLANSPRVVFWKIQLLCVLTSCTLMGLTLWGSDFWGAKSQKHRQLPGKFGPKDVRLWAISLLNSFQTPPTPNPENL